MGSLSGTFKQEFMRKFRSLYEGHLRGLKSLGADVDSAGYVFSELLIKKLPTKVSDNLNRAQKSGLLDA